MTEEQKQFVTNTLIERISQLFDELEKGLIKLRQHHFCQEKNQNRFEHFLNLLENCLCTLQVHKELDNIDSLETIDFSKEIMQYFDSRYNKKVEFYILNDDESKTLINPENIDELSNYFTVKGCLPIMHLVPMQLALNARKYMPIGTSLEVELNSVPPRNIITFRNIGPQCDSEEIDCITEEGIRGHNTYGYSGMGIGLSEVNTILNMHKKWLGTTFDPKSKKEYISFNGKNHSLFTASVSYRIEPMSFNISPALSDLKEHIPLFLIHNSLDIAKNLYDICDDILKIRERDNDIEWRNNIYRLRLFTGLLYKSVDECIFYTNDQDVDKILGSELSKFPIRNALVAIVRNLKESFYPDIELDICEGSLNNKYSQFDTKDGFRVFLLCICDLVMDAIRNNSTLLIDLYDDQISFKCEDADYELLENDNDYSDSFYMSQELIKALGGDMDISKHEVIIYLP